MSKTAIEQQRELLHEILSSIPGVKAVYYQPPSIEKIKYPCIMYELNRFTTVYSNNTRYLSYPQYTLTLIDKNPESEIQQHILNLGPNCYISFDRFFTSDNMNHWAYTLSFTNALW